MTFKLVVLKIDL